MKEVTVKIILLGDGMSGKTQILLTFGKILLNYLNEIYMHYDDLYVGEEGLRKNEHKKSNYNFSEEAKILSIDFLSWVNSHSFSIEYGDYMWDLSLMNLQTETIGIEDFQFIFPYVWNNTTYKVCLKGNDIGGQNIFDHFRAVLGKIAKPCDNMIVVFDKSRRLSCYNSIEHINEVLGKSAFSKNQKNSDQIQFWYVGNKIDLEKHINTQNWRKGIIDFLRKSVNTISSFTIPSLLDEGEEKLVYFNVTDLGITFPDLEALIYNAIRYSDEKYQTPIMSEVNTKALAREITAQLVYDQKIKEINKKDNLQNNKWLERFKSLIFEQRPLALQYLRGMSVFQKLEIFDDSYERIRSKWIGYEVNFPTIRENIEIAISNAGKADEILNEMPSNFSTNAILGTGVRELFDSIISKTILDSSLRVTKKSVRKRIHRF